MTNSPVIRICAGLVMLTVSALLFAQFIGVVPDVRATELEARKVVAESLAVHVSASIERDNFKAAKSTFRAVVERNESVMSVAVRTEEGALKASAGNHSSVWSTLTSEKSTATHVIVPLYAGVNPWGRLEIQFVPLGANGKGEFRGSFISLLAFLILSCSLAYYLFLRRALRELNPDAVIPERVRIALDTLTEGVLIVDAKEQIVFANGAFVSIADLGIDELLGISIHKLGWELKEQAELPWETLLRGDTPPGSVELTLTTPLGRRHTLVVNASPIVGGPNQAARGVMATFADVTELGKANDGLRHALVRLESNEKEIKRQNIELQELATRDSLTGCLNRRSFFSGFQVLMDEALSKSSPLSCIMVDIDYFKRINDNYGHATGDAVIKKIAELLIETSAADDLVGRYGGEEFCLVIPNCTSEGAVERAEEIRIKLCEGACTPIASMPLVTASFGVSELAADTEDHNALVNSADEALYMAKQNGRNRVEIFQSGLRAKQAEKPEPKEASVITSPKEQEHTNTSGMSTDDETKTLKVRINELESALTLRSSDGVLELVSSMPGRQLLIDRATQAIERAKRFQHSVAIVSVSVDALPRVRDALGEMAAEKLRESAVRHIKRTLRNYDSVTALETSNKKHCVSRMDSQHIGILLSEIGDVDKLPGVISRLHAAMKAPQEIAGNEISLSSDFGVSIYPQDSLDAVTMLRHSIAAMNAATSEPGQQNTRFYAAEINAKAKRRMRLETDLHRAIEKQEFSLHYQPKFDIYSAKVVGMEALLRWESPQNGMIPPDEFIPVAEQIGCISAISEQTIKTVCRQIKAWQQAGFGSIPVAVNLSAVEFRDTNFAKKVLATIVKHGIDPSLFEFEITESVVMENADSAVDIMMTLSNAGARIAIDDFGTGYATLQCLTQFPVSTIKIDRSFIMGVLDQPRDAAVVNGVTSLAHTMGLRVVAEGVENAEQLAYLSDLQCDEIQGYFLSRPLPSEQIRELLENPARVRNLIESTSQNRDSGKSGAQYLGLLNDVQEIEAI